MAEIKLILKSGQQHTHQLDGQVLTADFRKALWGQVDGEVTEVIIGVGVTEIGDYAFFECLSLTSVTLPDGLTMIGDHAFHRCSGLTSVTFPDGLREIGDSAFYKCSGLTSVTLPEGLTEIGWYAFYECSGLTSVTLPDGLRDIGKMAFYECSGLTSVTLPDGLREVGSYAFADCINLTSVTLPDGLRVIGEGAFAHCDGLTSVTLPEGLTEIGWYAFYECSGLTSVTLPDGLERIKAEAFYDFRQLNVVISSYAVWARFKECFPHASRVNPPEVTQAIMDNDHKLIHQVYSELYEKMVIPASPRLFGNTGFEKAPEDEDIQARLEQIKQYSQAHPTHRTAKVWRVVNDFFGVTELLNMTTLGGDHFSMPVSSEVFAQIHPQITAVGGEGYTGTLHDLYPTNFWSREKGIIHAVLRTHAASELDIKDQDGFTLVPGAENSDYIFLYNHPSEEEELAAAAP